MFGSKWSTEWFREVYVSCVVLVCVGGGHAVGTCDENTLVVYRVVLETFWTRELFPKQYPEFRPRAQWSKLIGRTHDSSSYLFKLGEISSLGFKQFVEIGQADILNSQQDDAVFDDFYGPAITTGAGKIETDFFADGNHSKVSVAVKIIPSPDWFIGIDSLDLCQNGEWIKSKIINVEPMDAGTDDGFTFTAPNWLSDPFHKIQRITSQFPRHPANSFYYPELQELPNIATFHFYKEKVYQMQTNSSVPNNIHPEDKVQISNDVLLPLGKDSILAVPIRKFINRRRGSKRHPVNCQVSQWTSWSHCSNSCSTAESQRYRKVMKHPRRGGHPCPLLTESRTCKSTTDCPQKYFQWN